MNRDDLDAFFAKADDVLTDWRGSVDAMHARALDAADLPIADSYYDQAGGLTPEQLQALVRVGQTAGEAIQKATIPSLDKPQRGRP